MKKLHFLFIFLYSTFLFSQDNRSTARPETDDKSQKTVQLKVPTAISLTLKEYYDQLSALNPAGVTIHQQQNPGSGDILSQQFEAANTNFTTNAADDFIVPPNKTWSIESVFADGISQGTIAPTVFNVTFYNNSAANLPSTVVRTETIVLSTGTASPLLPLATPLVLSSGTYWVSVQAVLNGATGRWYWKSYNAFDTIGANHAFKSPGQGVPNPCYLDWAYYSTCSSYYKFKDLEFKLTGTEMTTPCTSFSGQILTTDPKTARISRLGAASNCATPKAFPGIHTLTNNFRYKTYALTNNSTLSQCMTFALTNTDSAENEVMLAAYDTTFNPTDISQNYLGDTAFSSATNQTRSMDINVPAGKTVILVASEVIANTVFTRDYTINVYTPNCGGILKTVNNPKQKMSLYPNPTNKTLFVNGMDVKQAKVYDASGKLVNVKNNGNNVNVENLPKGTYLIQLEDKAGNVQSDKFIKN